MTKLLLRVDGNSNIGMGHLTRCLSLALMLKDFFKTTFYCIYIPDTFEAEIVRSGFNCFKIKNDNDFLELISFSDIVVLDHYGLNSDYQRKVKLIGCKLVCIDDLHDKEFFADLIINHAPGIREDDYTAQKYTQFALGLDYALLRPLFLEQAKKTRTIGSINTVFICFGGSDPENFTEKTLEILIDFKKFQKVIVVTGVAFIHEINIDKFSSKVDNLLLYKDIGELEMLNLMSSSDLLIVPASGVLLEAFSTGSFIVSGMCVDNQKYSFEEFKRQNLIISAENFSTNDIIMALNKAIKLPFIQKKSIDGNQPKRIQNKFLSLIVNLRQARPSDINLFFEWANDKIVRSNSINTEPIIYENHLEWFDRKLNSTETKIFVLELFGNPIGQIRFDKNFNGWFIDYSIDNEVRGKGFGQILVEKGLKQFNVADVFFAQVKESNIASVNVFNKLGFLKTKTIHNVITFEKTI
jgi:UDP-2,4-diacetamido-2,4,6-trideoxy-beta-L-altropyranose hydrolase